MNVGNDRRDVVPAGRGAPWVGIVVAVVVLAACGSSTDHSGSALSGHEGSHAGASLAPAALMGQPDRPITGPQGAVGQFVVECELSHVAPDDPIVYPGRPGESHLHAFFGNEAVTATSTLDDLLGASTSCDDVRDTAAYWVPVLLDDGAVVAPTYAVAYYRAGLDVDPTSVQAYPSGLVMIAGDPLATEPQPVSVVAWSCGNGSRRDVRPPSCDSSALLRLDVTFPDCWDGVNLDVPGHRDHLRYSSAGRCPESHPTAIPQLVLSVTYPVHGDVGGMRLASGSLLSGHADFVNSWDQDELESEVDLCIRRQNVCRISSGRMPF